MDDDGRKDGASTRWLFSALEVGQSIALGGDVRLELHPQTTVLVGKNGAGKSAILEAIQAGASGAVGVVDDSAPDPGRFAVELCHERVPEARVRYECRWHARELFDDTLETDSEQEFADIEETCHFGEAQLWSLKEGILIRNDGTRDVLPPGRGLLNWWVARKRAFVFNSMVEPLFEMLFVAIAYVRTGVPRAEMARSVAIIPHGSSRRGARFDKRYEHVAPGIRRLMRRLADWQEVDASRLDEFVEVGRRLGLFQHLKVELSPNPEHAADSRAPRMLLGVSVDGVNLGLLSDGTLRVLQILIDLVDPETKLLLLEEPEIAVHPGLLGRLLEEIDAYSTDRQILLSTQSPQVVSWAKPDSLRLVEREKGTTRVRSLSDDERARVERYLNDEGTLGDYLYAGALDG